MPNIPEPQTASYRCRDCEALRIGNPSTCNHCQARLCPQCHQETCDYCGGLFCCHIEEVDGRLLCEECRQYLSTGERPGEIDGYPVEEYARITERLLEGVL